MRSTGIKWDPPGSPDRSIILGSCRRGGQKVGPTMVREGIPKMVRGVGPWRSPSGWIPDGWIPSEWITQWIPNGWIPKGCPMDGPPMDPQWMDNSNETPPDPSGILWEGATNNNEPPPDPSGILCEGATNSKEPPPDPSGTVCVRAPPPPPPLTPTPTTPHSLSASAAPPHNLLSGFVRAKHGPSSRKSAGAQGSTLGVSLGDSQGGKGGNCRWEGVWLGERFRP